MGVSEVRRRWLIPLFQWLDFEPHYLRADTVIGESERLRFSLSHRGWHSAEEAPVLHTVAASQGLDERVEGKVGALLKANHPTIWCKSF
jgi:hypothetical protein